MVILTPPPLEKYLEKILSFCSISWAVNFAIDYQDMMNKIIMHDFISNACDSIEENLFKSI